MLCLPDNECRWPAGCRCGQACNGRLWESTPSHGVYFSCLAKEHRANSRHRNTDTIGKVHRERVARKHSKTSLNPLRRVIYDTGNKSSPTTTQVLRVSKLTMSRGVVGVNVWAVHQNTQVSFASNNPHCSLPAQAWLTLWPTGMLGVECDPNWGNVKSPRITSVARLSQRIQGDTESPLLAVHCANESACAAHRVSRQMECICTSILKAGFFFSPFK